jgi:hypothetical protein
MGGSPSPKTCPVCGGSIWTYSGEVANTWDKYWEHLDTVHPEFGRWIRNTSQIYWFATIPLFVIPAIGRFVFLPTNFLQGMSLIIGGWLVGLVYIVSARLLIRNPGFKRFRESWDNQHGGLSNPIETAT